MIHIEQGDNVPAPFMTFEATGFPPEILREVSYRASVDDSWKFWG